MERTNEIKGNKVIYPELSYKITGILFRVQNTIGVGHKERVYESAIAAAFTEEHIPFERQMYVPVMMGDERVGYYYLDFLVGNKIILELKSGIVFFDRILNKYIDI